MVSVLVLSPCPLSPVDSGNRRRIVGLVSSLREAGCCVDVFFMPHWGFGAADMAGMRRFVGDGRLHLGSPFPASLSGRVASKLRRTAYSVWTGRSLRRELAVDDHVNPLWHLELARVLRYGSFDAVVCEYAMFSWLLACVPEGVRKVIDTHDVFADRNRRMGTSGWFSMSEPDETTALRRGGHLLAIQEEEAEELHQRSGVPVSVVGHLVTDLEWKDLQREAGAAVEAGCVGFVGSSYSVNADGLRWFFAEVWPRIRKRVPAAKMKIVGSVCDLLDGVPGGVERLGRLSELRSFYATCAAIVNPVGGGTGLAIKSIEAMAHGKALVSTPAGARGLSSAVGRGLSVCSTAAEMGEAVGRLLSDSAYARAEGELAREFAGAYFGVQRTRLLEAIQGRRGSSAAGDETRRAEVCPA